MNPLLKILKGMALLSAFSVMAANIKNKIKPFSKEFAGELFDLAKEFKITLKTATRKEFQDAFEANLMLFIP